MASNGIAAAGLIESTSAFREIRVTLRRGVGLGAPSRVPSGGQELSLQVIDQRSRPGSLPRQRSFEPAQGQLLVVAVDGDGRARWAASTPEPRLLRAEFPDADGSLRGEVLERPQAELVLQVPEGPDLTEARVYRPRRNGPGPALELIGAIPLG